MIAEHDDDAPLVLLANFASPVPASLDASEAVRGWSAQAPRKIWLARPGDVLVSPVPLSEDFLRYAGLLLGLPHDTVEVVVVPDLPGTGMPEAIRHHGLGETLMSLARRHPGTRLLPIVLDGASVALAAELGIQVYPFASGRPGACVLSAVDRLNTKTGFRAVAHARGIRMPEGRVCRGDELPDAVARMVSWFGRAVVKADRSAGGLGMRFFSRHDPAVAAEQDGSGLWVVERCVRHTKEVSVQCVVEAAGPRVMFSGEILTRDGSFTGYRSPLRDVPSGTIAELEGWGLALGQHLAAHRYAGPYGIDALLGADGTLYATESNVRRTATTTPHAMVTRLSHAAKRPTPAWLIAKRTTRAPHTFSQAVQRLHTTGLAYGPAHGEGVILYTGSAGRPTGPSPHWRYAVLGHDRPRIEELESELATVLDLVDP
ncbi:peptide ligase PGM1-related protein [Streptomyces sp. NPDC057543]|uniref:preATP grasp domain-containing protein n=1 Tax=Streptomyces sp. NPDC057543 TaxID=3346163 RepID=UPI00369E1132